MRYLIVKKFNDIGVWLCRYRMVSIEEKLMKAVGYNTIQIVMISCPSVYGEYEPYHFWNIE